jgi:hypothetical protein
MSMRSSARKDEKPMPGQETPNRCHVFYITVPDQSKRAAWQESKTFNLQDFDAWLDDKHLNPDDDNTIRLRP